MLVLTRKLQQQIKIGDGITVTILRVKGQTVRVGIEAPRDTRVVRGELTPKSTEQRAEEGAAAEASHDDVPEVEELAFVITGDDFVEDASAGLNELRSSGDRTSQPRGAATDAEATPCRQTGRAPRQTPAADNPAKAPRLPQRKRFNRTDNPPLRVAMQSLSTALAK